MRRIFIVLFLFIIVSTMIGAFQILIISSGNFADERINDLPFASENGRLLKYFFENLYGKNYVELLENPSRYDIEKALEEFSKGMKEDDTFIIFYSGYSFLDERNERLFLIPFDVDPEFPIDTGLDFAKIQEILKDHVRSAVILDLWPLERMNERIIGMIVKESNINTMVFIENESRSVFGQWLVEGLKGAVRDEELWVEFGKLCEYISKKAMVEGKTVMFERKHSMRLTVNLNYVKWRVEDLLKHKKVSDKTAKILDKFLKTDLENFSDNERNLVKILISYFTGEISLDQLELMIDQKLGKIVWKGNGTCTLKILAENDLAKKGRVYIDEMYAGDLSKGELEIRKIPTGEHVIVLDGDEISKVTVPIRFDLDYEIQTLSLKAEKAKREVLIKTEPEGATVFINGERLEGFSPLRVKLEVGREYEIRIVKRKYKELIKKFFIPSKGDILVWNFHLEKNKPPTIPEAVFPENGKKMIDPKELTLKWKSSDPDNDELSFDLYFGVISPPPLFKRDLKVGEWKLKNLEYGKWYYWRIIAKDSEGNTTAGDIWRFRTLKKCKVTIKSNVPGVKLMVNGFEYDLPFETVVEEGDKLTFDVKKILKRDERMDVPGDDVQYKFIKWSDGFYVSKRTIEVTEDISLEIIYTPIMYKVFIEKKGMGDISVNEREYSQSEWFKKDEKIHLTASTEGKWRFSKWVINTREFREKSIAIDVKEPLEIKVYFEKHNTPPIFSRTFYPENFSEKVEPDKVILRWDCFDPDGDPLTYDLYFGKTSDPPLMRSNLISNNYVLKNLEYGTTYFWRIVARDPDGGVTESPIWCFTTKKKYKLKIDSNLSNAIVKVDDKSYKTPIILYFPEDTVHTVTVEKEILKDNDKEVPFYDTKYEFMKWNDGKETSIRRIVLTSDKDLKVIYQPVSFKVSSKVIGKGSINIKEKWCEKGEIVVLNALPDEGWKFVRWETSKGEKIKNPFLRIEIETPIFLTAIFNKPPEKPRNPEPSNNARKVNITGVILKWECEDPGGDPLLYDVYFGTSPEPPLRKTGLKDHQYFLGTLNYGTKYYWKIVARDPYGESVESPVWSFETIHIYKVSIDSNVKGLEITLNGMKKKLPIEEWVLEEDVLKIEIPQDLYKDESDIVPGYDVKYSFKKWSDGNMSTERTLKVMGDIKLSAEYSPVLYKVIVEKEGEGYVNIREGWYSIGSKIELKANARKSWKLSHWIITGKKYPPTLDNIKVSNPLKISAIFERINYPPERPTSPYPKNGSYGVPLDVNLKWNCRDPENDALHFDLYFGRTPAPPLYAKNIRTTSFKVTNLMDNCTYYWKVVAKDTKGNVTEGPVWRFRTLKIYKGEEIAWEMFLNSSKDYVIRDAIETEDKGFLIVGSIKNDAFILKLNNYGHIEWEKTYGGSKKDEFNSITSTNDGDYIVVGSTSSNDGTLKGMVLKGTDGWVVKINKFGEIIWQKVIGYIMRDQFTAVDTDTYGNVIVVGKTESDIPGSYKSFVVKINENGRIIWKRKYGGSGAWDVVCSGNYIYMSGGKKGWIAKIDGDGSILWWKSIPSIDEILGIVLTHDERIFGVGYVQTGWINKDICVVKLNSENGKSLWVKKYGGSFSEVGYNIVEMTDHRSLLIVGYTESRDGDLKGYKTRSGKDVWILKISKNDGSIIKQIVAGSSLEDVGIAVLRLKEGNYGIVASRKNKRYLRNIWILKLE